MKQCPTCHLTYEDDSLRFCTNDGETLVRLDDSGVPTMTMPAGAVPAEPAPTVLDEGETQAAVSEPPPTQPPSYPTQFQPPPAPVLVQQIDAPRPVRLRPIAIASFVIGLLVLVSGIAKILPGGIGTGFAFAFWGALLFGFSFIPLPQATATDEPKMSGLEKLTSMFYEPSRVYRNLRSYPSWLAAFVVIVVVGGIYSATFVQRLTPDRIVDYTFDKMEQSPIKPPPDQMAKSKADALQTAKQPIQRVQTFAKSFVGLFVFISLLSAIYLVGILAFGGRINFWQAFAATLYSLVPTVVIGKTLSLVILFIKAPEDIHPLLGQETLLQDNLGVLFSPAEHPVFFVLATSVGVLSFYGLWLRVKGLQYAGTKVSSSAAWGVVGTLWVLGLLLLAVFTFFFAAFIS